MRPVTRIQKESRSGQGYLSHEKLAKVHNKVRGRERLPGKLSPATPRADRDLFASVGESDR